MSMSLIKKSDLLSDLLSEVFTKHLTLCNPNKYWHFK